jgi:hypothetical protein
LAREWQETFNLLPQVKKTMSSDNLSACL